MLTCPSCGQANPDGFRLCGMCGAALLPLAAQPREERKVMTVLFADLVGFTARAEQLDPEDVRALLAPYHARLRAELERHGGTVEKFIGDAVMALFGAPVVHEDDPERAVRAAIAIRDWVREEGELELRIGVNTGEALIRMRGGGRGHGLGDVVNATARLQSAAPVNGILVGETTYRATSRADRVPRGSPGRGEGKDRPDSRLGGSAATCAVRRRSAARAADAGWWGATRDCALLVDALARVHGSSAPSAGDARRGAGHREEPARLRAVCGRSRPTPTCSRMAAGSLVARTARARATGRSRRW